MSLSAMIRKRQPGTFATATVATLATVQPKLKPSVATVASVASVAVANAETGKTGDGKPSSRWLFHFADRDDLPVTFAPAVDHAAALAYYPDAVAAEPIPERPQRQPTKAEAVEIAALVRATYANDTDEDRAEALAAALADPDGALLCYRTIASDRGINNDDRRD
jgi:phage protein D